MSATYLDSHSVGILVITVIAAGTVVLMAVIIMLKTLKKMHLTVKEQQILGAVPWKNDFHLPMTLHSFSPPYLCEKEQDRDLDNRKHNIDSLERYNSEFII